jgi:F0F1-type ATP synthase assembly protein I
VEADARPARRRLGRLTVSPERPTAGRDVAGAGFLLLAVNLLCAGIGAGIGALVGALAPLLIVGFLIGFFAGIAFVIRRFRDG